MLSGAKWNRNISDFSGRLGFLASLGMTLGNCEIFNAQALMTFVVLDVDTVYAKAIAQKLEILQPPRNEFYGQHQFLTVDPHGCIVDISSPLRVDDE